MESRVGERGTDDPAGDLAAESGVGERDVDNSAGEPAAESGVGERSADDSAGNLVAKSVVSAGYAAHIGRVTTVLWLTERLSEKLFPSVAQFPTVAGRYPDAPKWGKCYAIFFICGSTLKSKMSTVRQIKAAGGGTAKVLAPVRAFLRRGWEGQLCGP